MAGYIQHTPRRSHRGLTELQEANLRRQASRREVIGIPEPETHYSTVEELNNLGYFDTTRLRDEVQNHSMSVRSGRFNGNNQVLQIPDWSYQQSEFMQRWGSEYNPTYLSVDTDMNPYSAGKSVWESLYTTIRDSTKESRSDLLKRVTTNKGVKRYDPMEKYRSSS